jgi:AcrR family transcriptional regulator
MTRQDAKAMTRERLLGEARRLFRDRGYAATSLEQIAEAAGVTKGAIYGHFSSKEDLLTSAIEAAPAPAWLTDLNNSSLPLRDRLAEFGRTMAVDEAFRDKAGLAMELEFIAALLRSPDDLRRYSALYERRLAELADADPDKPLPGTTPADVWVIGAALLCGLQIYQHIAPDLLTPALFERACGLAAGLYPEDLSFGFYSGKENPCRAANSDVGCRCLAVNGNVPAGRLGTDTPIALDKAICPGCDLRAELVYAPRCGTRVIEGAGGGIPLRLAFDYPDDGLWGEASVPEAVDRLRDCAARVHRGVQFQQ